MPEGHTIHRLARDLRADLRGERVDVSSPQGRFGAGAARVDGRELTDVTAWGKHLFVDFSDGELVHIHLGLIGRFRRSTLDSLPDGAIRLRLIGPDAAWSLSGPQWCRLVTPDDAAATIARLGPDPLRVRRAGPFVDRLRRRRSPLATALLDQSVVAGIGNVYRSELPFLIGLDPRTPASDLNDAEAEALWQQSRRQLRQGVRLNRIVTVEPEDAGRSAGRIRPGDRLYVYKRRGQPCRRCATPIDRTVLGNRKAWWCPVCQPDHPSQPAAR